MGAGVQIRKAGDRWPNLHLTFPLPPGTTASYDFRPDSRRHKTRRNVPLKVLDHERGLITPPHARVSGYAQVTLHYPNGQHETLLTDIRFVRDF